MTDLSKYDKYFYRSMRDLMEDDEHHGLVSTDWDGDFRSGPRYRDLEVLATLTFKNVKVGG